MRNEAPDGLIVLSHLEVQNANTISSALTWGFPAITSILGFVHALERKLKEDEKFSDLKLTGVSVACHKFNPHIYQSSDFSEKVFSLTRNPVFTKKQLAKFNNEGTPPAFVEEGRANMEISLVIQAYSKVFSWNDSLKQEITAKIFNIAQTLRLAGGSIIKLNRNKSKLIDWSSDAEEQKKILRTLMPGFILINREDLLVEKTKQLREIDANKTALDALLEFSSLNFEPLNKNLESSESEWIIQSKPGWLVPIPVGFVAISEVYAPGKVANARDNQYPFCFVENIYSLGQWVSPHRIKYIEDTFWYFNYDQENKLYRCINDPKDVRARL